MAKDTATDKDLSALHKKVAKAMIVALDSCEAAQELLDGSFEDEEGEEIFIPDEVRLYLKKQVQASPSLLTAVTKFLKDNDITCQVEEDESMTDLEKRLEDKRTRKQVGNVLPISDE